MTSYILPYAFVLVQLNSLPWRNIYYRPEDGFHFTSLIRKQCQTEVRSKIIRCQSQWITIVLFSFVFQEGSYWTLYIQESIDIKFHLLLWVKEEVCDSLCEWVTEETSVPFKLPPTQKYTISSHRKPQTHNSVPDIVCTRKIMFQNPRK